LEDGSVYPGKSFGAQAPSAEALAEEAEKRAASQSAPFTQPAAGEVVFNTSMTGYHEILTDPSYTGQVVMMTYPHIGNYGSLDAWSESSPDRSSSIIAASGLIVRDYYDGPIQPERRTLGSFMEQQGIPGISRIDTRRLTLDLRDNGTRNGVIVRAAGEDLSRVELDTILSFLSTLPQMTGLNLVNSAGVSRKTVLPHRMHASADQEKRPLETAEDTTDEDWRLHFALLDCGTKANIAEELQKRGIRITVFPADSDFTAVMSAEPDALFFSNGPGDPAVLNHQIELAAQAVGRLPVYGICLGHQIIALALGAKTYKMQFGHHGGNHPVRDIETGRVCVTSQNHGFAVSQDSLPEQLKLWFVNANDQSVEGIKHNDLPVMSVQFHPEAAPGPHDASWIFDAFIQSAVSWKS